MFRTISFQLCAGCFQFTCRLVEFVAGGFKPGLKTVPGAFKSAVFTFKARDLLLPGIRERRELVDLLLQGGKDGFGFDEFLLECFLGLADLECLGSRLALCLESELQFADELRVLEQQDNHRQQENHDDHRHDIREGGPETFVVVFAFPVESQVDKTVVRHLCVTRV